MNQQKKVKAFNILYKYDNFFSLFLFIISIKIVLNNNICPNEEPFIYSGSCTANCDLDFIISGSCIPISSKGEDIEQMYDKIKGDISTCTNSMTNEKIIKGEGIDYQITPNSFVNNQISNLKNIEFTIDEECLNRINGITRDYSIILINIINNNYTTSFDGFKVVKNGYTDDYDIKTTCEGNNISFGIPVSIPNDILSTFNKINDEYN